MPFFEITITGTKQFFVEADTEAEALEHEIVADEMSCCGDIEWETDEASAKQYKDTPDLEQCKRHGIKVFDSDGVEYEA